MKLFDISLVRSIFEYCCPLFASMTKKCENINSIEFRDGSIGWCVVHHVIKSAWNPYRHDAKIFRSFFCTRWCNLITCSTNFCSPFHLPDASKCRREILSAIILCHSLCMLAICSIVCMSADFLSIVISVSFIIIITTGLLLAVLARPENPAGFLGFDISR